MAPKNDRPQRQETRKLLPELRLKVNRDRRKPGKADRLSGCPEGRGERAGVLGLSWTRRPPGPVIILPVVNPHSYANVHTHPNVF